MVKQKTTFVSLFLKLVGRSFTRSWLQFLSVIATLGIATTLFIGLTSNAKAINNRVSDFYKKSNMADIWCYVSTYDENDDNEIAKYGNFEKRYSISGSVNAKTGNLVLVDDYPSICMPYETDSVTDKFFIVDEAFLNDEINYNKWYDNYGNYKKGDVSVTFTAIRNELINRGIMDQLNNPLIRKPQVDNFLDSNSLIFKSQVTGKMKFPENVETLNISESTFLMSKEIFKEYYNSEFKRCFYTNLEQVKTLQEELFNNIFSYNQYVIKLKDGQNINDTKAKIQEYFNSKENNNLVIAIDVNHLPSNVTIQSDITQAKQLAYIFPVVFFLVGILVVLTTTSQLIIKERIQIGTLKGIGVSNKKIVAIYTSLTMFVVLIGSLLGTIAGPLIIPQVMNRKYDILYSLPAFKYALAIPETLITIGICLLVTFVVTLYVLRSEIKLLPSETMRPRVISSFKAKENERTAKSTRMISLKMAMRNIRVDLVKSLMVIIGIMGCTTLLVAGFGIDNTLDHSVEHDINMIYNADISVAYNVTGSLKERIMEVEGIDDVTEYATSYANVINEINSQQMQTTIYSIPENYEKYFKPDDDYKFGDDIAITQKIAVNLNVNIGDELSFTVLGKNYKGKIGKIFNCFYIHGIYLSAKTEAYENISSNLNSGWITIKEGYDHQKIANTLKTTIDEIPSCSTKEENRARIENYMESIKMMTLTVKIFAILLAIVALYNLALLNLKERSRDIATLKVLGYSRLEIMRSLLIETMFLSSIGAIVGLFFGEPFERLILLVNRTPIVEYLNAVYPSTYLISFALTFFAALIINLILSLRIKKISMVESLKSVE